MHFTRPAGIINPKGCAIVITELELRQIAVKVLVAAVLIDALPPRLKMLK